MFGVFWFILTLCCGMCLSVLYACDRIYRRTSNMAGLSYPPNVITVLKVLMCVSVCVWWKPCNIFVFKLSWSLSSRCNIQIHRSAFFVFWCFFFHRFPLSRAYKKKKPHSRWPVTVWTRTFTNCPHFNEGDYELNDNFNCNLSHF